MRPTPASKQAMVKFILAVAAAVALVATWRCLRESGADAPARDPESRADRGSAAAVRPPRDGRSEVPGAVSRPVAAEVDAVSADRLVRGRVVDRGGIPVNHASIRVELVTPRNGWNYAAADEFETTVSVDALGNFAAVVPRHGRYQLAARARGFAPVARTPVTPGDDVEIALDVPCRVSGRVLDARTGEAIAGAALRLSSWAAGVPFERGLTATSGPGGGYAFDDVPSGDVMVAVVADRYVSSSANASMTLQPGEEKVHDFRVEKGLTISGRVVDGQTGRPIAGATFDGRDGATGEDGAFALSGFETGERRLVAWAKGFVPEARDITVSARRELDAFEFKLRRAATISGIVLGPDGNPVAGATVLQQRERVTTGKDGGFEIALEVEAGSLASSWCALWVDWPPRDLVAVEFDFAEVPRPFVIRLKPQDARVSGTVRSGEGKPVAGARVSVQGTSFRRLLETDARGGFALEKLPRSASVEVAVLARGFDYAEVKLEAQGPESATGIEIVLSPYGTRRREEEERAARARPAEPPEKPKPTGRVRGRVVDAAAGSPLASQATVGLHTAEQGGRHVESGTSKEGSGDFEIEAPVGEAWLEAGADGYAASDRRRLAIAEAMTTDVGTIALVRSGSVEGIILSASGAAPGRRLGVVVGKPDGGPFRWEGWADDTGWYELGGLARGDWLVYGAEDSSSFGSNTLIHLSLLGTARVDSGGVARLDGRMAAPASLVVEAATGPGAAKLEESPSFTSECDPNRFDFDHLPDALAVSIRSKSGVPIVWVNRTLSSPWFAAVWRTESAKVELPVPHLAAGEYVVKVQRAGVAVERTVRLETGEARRVVVDLSR